MSRSDRALRAIAGLLPLLSACAAAGAKAPTKGPSPSEIAVPQPLRARTATIEPSGVVWAAPLDRFLVVSDDTGPDDARHAPWVLAMDRAGAFDAEPVPIAGLDALNDAESICAGPDGTFFLTTSHSPNKKGKTHAERRMVLHLKLDGRALAIRGRADLTTARGSNGETLLEIAQLPADGRLDIEAITFRDGAILFGLKSPLSAKGGAVVLRLASPVEVLREGRIPPGAVTRLWEIPLHVDVSGTQVAQGIADLTSLPDGDVVLVANAPKGMPPDGGGALYRYKPGAPAPVLLHRFAGLKPEGVTLAPDGKSLVLVFDNDMRAPLWMKWPLAAAAR